MNQSQLNKPFSAWLFYSRALDIWYCYFHGNILAVGYDTQEVKENAREAIKQSNRNPDLYTIEMAPGQEEEYVFVRKFDKQPKCSD